MGPIPNTTHEIELRNSSSAERTERIDVIY